MSLHFASHVDPLALDESCVLGVFEVGSAPEKAAVNWPKQHVRAKVLFPDLPTLGEAWVANAPVESGQFEGIAWRRHAGVLFGTLDLEEALASEAEAHGRSPERSDLRLLSEQAYAQIFRLLDAQGLPHLWRVWNFIPDINGEQAGLERYRQFNMGRGDAFEAGARSVIEQVPAACALGVDGGPLTISFVASNQPLIPIENPRQVSAYRYPQAYGPRSPTFSRAGMVCLADQLMLFVSGTASIVGHESVHLGDVTGQAQESMNNVQALLDQARLNHPLARFDLESLTYRVYVRKAADLSAVRSALGERIGQAQVHFVQADICRSDLLVEVEAFGQVKI